MADQSYQPCIYRKQGGNELVVASSGVITVESGGSIAMQSGSYLTMPVFATTASSTMPNHGIMTVNGTTRITVTLAAPVAGCMAIISSIGVSTANAANSHQVVLNSTNTVIGTSDRLVNLPNKHDHVVLIGISTSAWAIAGLGGSGLAGTTVVVTT
jgi:hypothetical protein